MSRTKLEKLTPEQEALIPVYREKWRKIALSTDRIDREKAAEAVKAAYAVNGFREPEIFRFDSPYNGLLELSRLQQSLGNLGERLNQEVQHHNKWFFGISWQLDSNLERQLRDQLYRPLDYLRQLFSPLTKQLETQLLFTSLIEPKLFYNSISSDSLASSYCYFDFCISVLNCEHNSAKWQSSQALLQTSGWIFPFERVCIICERHTKISIDDKNHLHAVGQPALVFADGFSVYAYRGALMSEKYSSVFPYQWRPEWYLQETDFRLRQALIEFLPSDQLQVNWLLDENNEELRQLLIQKIGFTRIYQELRTGDNLNLLEPALQEDSGSTFWVAYTLLQNREEPLIKQVIDTWISRQSSNAKPFENNIVELRKAVLTDCLERILTWLQQNAPSYAEGFLPSLSYKEIEYKVRNLPFKIPWEVYDLYQWRNGTDSEAMIFVYHYFWHLDMALEISEGLNDSWWLEMRNDAGEPLYLFPIFEFEGEYFAVLGKETQIETAPVFHIAADGGGIARAFNSLTTMMLAIAESYETGVYQLTPEGRLEWHEGEKSRLIRLKYNPGTADSLYVEGG